MDPALLKCSTPKEFLRYARRAGAEIDLAGGKGSHVRVLYEGKFVETIRNPGTNIQFHKSACKKIMTKFTKAGMWLQ